MFLKLKVVDVKKPTESFKVRNRGGQETSHTAGTAVVTFESAGDPGSALPAGRLSLSFADPAEADGFKPGELYSLEIKEFQPPRAKAAAPAKTEK